MTRQCVKYDDIKRLASQAGFDLCGVSPVEYLDVAEGHFREWLDMGYGDDLGYLHRNLDLRFDATKLVEGARSVVVCGVNYKSQYSLTQDPSSGVAIASYALLRDYHKTLKRRMKGLFRELQSIYPNVSGRIFVDSAPLLEKHYAQRAGLGWIGRQSLLVTPQLGTFVLLCELVIDCDVDRYDDPMPGGIGCGSCRKCIESCPANAINDNRTIDARKCIACRTIECEDAGSEPLAGWVFGCDMCQRCCPHNQSTPLAVADDMLPRVSPPSAEQWQDMSDEQFAEFAQGTPMKRSSLERIKHNVYINRERS